MHVLFSSIASLTLITLCTGTGCTASATPEAEYQTRTAGTDAPQTPTVRAGDPRAAHACALVTLAEVRRVHPDAKPGKAEWVDVLDLARCDFGSVVLAYDPNAMEPAMDSLRGWAVGFVDPLRPGVEKNVRFVPIDGTGDDAALFVEQQDKAKGILNDIGMIVVRKGNSEVTLLLNFLRARPRDEVIAALTELGRAAAARMK